MSINTQLVTVTVDPLGLDYKFECLLTLGDYSQERGKTEYNCMSSNDSTVGLGSITRAPLEFTGLYNENTADGQDLLKVAFEANNDIKVNIEFDNSPVLGAAGTQLEGEYGVSKYVMSFPKDGKIGVAFTLEFTETPALIPAGSQGAKAHGGADYTGSVAVGDGDSVLTIGAVVITLAVSAGWTAHQITEEMSELIEAEGTYGVGTVDGVLYIWSKVFGIVDNGVTVVDSSSDTGILIITQDFAGGIDPV